MKVKRFTASVEPTPKALAGRILDEKIIDNQGNTIGQAGDLVNEELAEKIAQSKGDELVKVKGWQGEHDAGMALIRIFGRMAALVSDRLNKVPDKNFLAFLDLIGTQLLPPQPAKVPLTFSLVEGSPVDALVPAHTQVAAPPAEGQEDEVVFETDRELVVMTAQLKAVFVREPEKDSYSDRTSQATDEKGNAAFEAFTGEQPIEHCLYLACDELFALPGNKNVTLKFDFTEATDLAKLPINWLYWDGNWQVVNSTVNSLEGGRLQEVVIPNLPVLTKHTINGIEARWLKASLNKPLLDKDATKGTAQLKVKDISSFMLANNTIRLAAGSSNQEDCKIISVDSKQKTLTLETPLKYSHPKETSVWFLELPRVNRITASANIERNNLTPDFCFFNTVPIDISKDFYPFGEQPRFNDTLYIASQEVFARSGAIVTIDLQLSDALPVKTDGGVEIAWEAWNGYSWKPLKTTTLKTTTLSEKATIGTKTIKIGSTEGLKVGDYIRINLYGNTEEYNKIAEINNDRLPKELTLESNLKNDQDKDIIIIPAKNSITLTGSGKVSLTLPSEIAQGTVNGKTSYWIRARIVKGDYGKPAITKQCSQDNKLSSDSNGHPIYEFIEASFQPPSVKSLSLSYEYKSSSSLSACRAYNDFHYVDLLNTTLTQVVRSFAPFTPTADQSPTLYLGFDKPFPNRSIALYLQVESPQPGEITKATLNRNKPITDSPRIIWEYYNSKDWVSLGVKDGTNAFTQRGVIEFIGPHDLTSRSEFDQTLYWIRARCEGNEFLVQPCLRRILTNTIWASQVTTIKEELLGSSNDNPEQIFSTAQKPVLKGQQLEVQETKIPSPEELAVIRSQEGDDAVKEVKDEAGQIEAVWVRWHKVRDFYGSEPRDRHYVLDRLTGEVRFGNGQYGMVPPQGRNNIRLSQYQTGGGTRGNLAANTVVQLKTTVPYVEKVTNLEAAGGGAEQESLERVKERGPKWLRHRDRAVTVQDFEDLAYEASTEVARAKAITPQFDPFTLAQHKWIEKSNKKSPQDFQGLDAGVVKLIVVPNSTASQPVPSISLLDMVKTYIRDRCSPVINLQITEPDWVKVSVTTNIVPISMDVADQVKAAAEDALLKFLHPLTGGRKGQGWAFGRLLHESDLYALLESIEGVDYVQFLNFKQELLLKNEYIDISDNKNKKESIKQRLALKKFIIFSDSNTVKIDAR